MICEQFAEQRKFTAQSIISLAWHTEAFARQKRLPRLQTMLNELDRDSHSVSKADALLKAMAKEKGVIIK